MKHVWIFMGGAMVVFGLVGLVLLAGFWMITTPYTDVSALTPSTLDSDFYNNMMNNRNSTGMTGMDSEFMRNMMTDFSQDSYASSGEQLFLTAQDSDGAFITPTFDSAKMPMMGTARRDVACVNCHGTDGKGGYLFPDGETTSADIRWSVLGDEFDQASFDAALREGVDENGQSLSVWMPRWEITDKQAEELVAYLKTL